MLAEWANGVQTEFGNVASFCAVIVFLSTVPFCAHQRRWPDIGPTVVLLISSTGTISSVKVVLLMMLLPLAQLGALANDKATLLVGGLITLVVSLRTATASWRKVACI